MIIVAWIVLGASAVILTYVVGMRRGSAYARPSLGTVIAIGFLRLAWWLLKTAIRTVILMVLDIAGEARSW